jgi:hypothetical protein
MEASRSTEAGEYPEHGFVDVGGNRIAANEAIAEGRNYSLLKTTQNRGR